jgi:3-polyprenyl-4-hydroxybenzoate decarboxylase
MEGGTLAFNGDVHDEPLRGSDFQADSSKGTREYIAFLKEHGEVVEVSKQVDLNLEVGAIIRRVNETGAPAPVFTDTAGSESGMRILGAPTGVSAQKEEQR